MISLFFLSMKYMQTYFDLYSFLQFSIKRIFIAYLLKIFTFSVFFHNEKYLLISFDIALIND